MMGFDDLDDYWSIHEPVKLEPANDSEISESEGLKLGIIVSVISTTVLLFLLLLGLVLW